MSLRDRAGNWWFGVLDPDRSGVDARLGRGLHEARLVLAEAFRDKIHIRSGFLALWAVEALVPLLMVVIAFARPLGYASLVESTVLGVAGPGSIFGLTSETVVEGLDTLLSSSSLGALGVGGVASSLFIIWQLFVAATHDLHELQWQRMRHGAWSHLARFLGFTVWTMALLGGGVASSLAAASADRPFVALGVPVAWSAVCLGGAAWWFSARRPSATAMFLGGMVGAVWWELLKTWFRIYTTHDFGTDSLSSLYLSGGFIPIFLLWMHLTWFSLLLSTVVVRHVDHREALWCSYVARVRSTVSRRDWPDVTLARHIWPALEDSPTSLARVAEALQRHPGIVAETLRHLCALGLAEECSPTVFKRTADAADLDADDVERSWCEARVAERTA